MPNAPCIITAIGTPLDAEELLHEEGLERHLADQWYARIDGILIAGSMGLMQMLRDETYRVLVERAAALSRGKGEILVGVGDAGWSRTRDRIDLVSRFCNRRRGRAHSVSISVSQTELVDYFSSLADVSPVPLYLYDLPARTGVALDIETYESLSKHPRIRGAKISGRLEFAGEFVGHLDPRSGIVVAEPEKVMCLCRGNYGTPRRSVRHRTALGSGPREGGGR